MLAPHTDARHHLPLGLYTEAATAQGQQYGAQHHAWQKQRHAAQQLAAFSHAASPE